MTKKDYVLIAEVLKQLAEDAAHCFDNRDDQLSIAHRFATVLAAQNPQFNTEKFINACLPE